MPTQTESGTDAMLAEWQHLKDQLAQVKEREAFLRRELVTHMFSGATSGTEIVPLSNGWKLKATKPLNYKVKEGPALDELDTLCEANNMAAVFEDLFRYKIELNVGIYKESMPLLRSMLTPDLQHRLDKVLAAVITIEPGMPQLELIGPKGK